MDSRSMAESLKNEDEKMLQIINETRIVSLTSDGFLPLENLSEDYQCPLSWRECFEKFDDVNWVRALRFLLSKESHDWRNYCLNILLGCVLSHLKEEEAFTMFDTCEKLLEKNKSEKFFVDIIEGLEHVLLSSRMYLYRITGRKDAAEEISRRIRTFGELNKECQAAVFATKAHILRQFEYDVFPEGLKCARLAIELDPDDSGSRRGAWYCLAGKILAEIRHTESLKKMPSEEEIKLLERSLEKDPFPSHLSYMANTYRDLVRAQRETSYRKGVAHYTLLLMKAKEMYEICIKDKSTPAAVLANCGMGLIKLPGEYRNVKLAKEAFEKAMNSGSKKAIYGMGNLLNWHIGNYKEALKYYEKAYTEGMHRAGLEIIRMKYKIDNNYNPFEDCDKFIKNLDYLLDDRHRKDTTVAYHAIKAEYLLLKKKDLISAIKEWKIAMDNQCNSKFLWDIGSFFEDRFIGLRLSIKLCMEIEKALAQRKFAGNDEKYLKNIYEEFPPKCKNYQNNVSWRK